MIHANETPRHPHADDYADIEAAWGEDVALQSDGLSPYKPEPFAGDALAVAATEYVAAEVRVEPLWKALIVMVCAFVAAVGAVAWMELIR